MSPPARKTGIGGPGTFEATGSFGWTGQSSDAIGRSSGERWRLAPTLSWRFLDFGRVRRSIEAAEARAEAAYARFERTWRLALEETENALANYVATSETVATLEMAVGEAEDASRLARLRYDNGADSFLAVLDAERTSLDLQDQLQGESDLCASSRHAGHDPTALE